MTTISAVMLADSMSSVRQDKRASSLLLEYPRCIHSEFMTHRQLSRNASSSRAIPVERMIKKIMDDPFVPRYWGANQKGMQAGEECHEDVTVSFDNGQVVHLNREKAWDHAMARALHLADAFSRAGYHKQIVNRLLEPFAHIKVVVTATEWSNFMALRDHKDAEPHIRDLAQAIKEAMRDSNPNVLVPGDWHLPFVTSDDWEVCYQMVLDRFKPEDQKLLYNVHEARVDLLRKLSVARCARTSYDNHDGTKPSIEADIKLHDMLVAQVPLHASPAEHQCTPDTLNQMDEREKTWWRDAGDDGWHHPELHGNLVGFIQYRKQLPGECQ